MTKANLKAAFTKLFSKAFEENWNDSTLETLKDLNEKYGDGHRWCSWDTNLIGVIQGGNSRAISKALEAYRLHSVIRGENKIMEEFAIATNNFEI